MKLERCLVGTLEEMREAQAAVDKALGYPRRGRHVGGGRHVGMPDTWDGQGPCPPGWTKSASEPVEAADGTTYLVVTGLEADLGDPEKLTKVTGRQRAVLAKVTQAELVSIRDIVNAAQDAREAKGEAPLVIEPRPKRESVTLLPPPPEPADAPADPKLKTGTKVAIVAGVAVTLAAAAYELAQQMGILN